MRLGIVSALAVNTTLTFNDLKKLLKTTDGNLSVHARKLEEAEYIACTKSFEGRLPRTEYRLTAAGRRALQRYLDHMEALIKATRERDGLTRAQLARQLGIAPSTVKAWEDGIVTRPNARVEGVFEDYLNAT